MPSIGGGFINGGDFVKNGGGLVTTMSGLVVPAGLLFLQNTLNKSMNLEHLYKKQEKPINDKTYDELVNLASYKPVRKIKNITRRIKNKFYKKRKNTKKNKKSRK